MRTLVPAFSIALVLGAVAGSATAGERIISSGCTVNVTDAGVASSALDSDCVWGDGDRLTFQCDGGVAYSKDSTEPSASTHPQVAAGDPYPFTALRSSSTNPLKVKPLSGTYVSCQVFASDRQ